MICNSAIRYYAFGLTWGGGGGGRRDWGGGEATVFREKTTMSSSLSTGAPLLSPGPFSLAASLASAISLSEAVMRTLHLFVVVVAAAAFGGAGFSQSFQSFLPGRSVMIRAPLSGPLFTGTFLGLPRPRFTGGPTKGCCSLSRLAMAAAVSHFSRIRGPELTPMMGLLPKRENVSLRVIPPQPPPDVLAPNGRAGGVSLPPPLSCLILHSHFLPPSPPSSPSVRVSRQPTGVRARGRGLVGVSVRCRVVV